MGREPLADVTRVLEHTARAVQSLLAEKFPASGGHPYPDANGNVCVAERHGTDGQTAASAYASAVPRLGKLVAGFRQAALLQADRAAKKFLPRMMPAEPALHRQDDATAACIWLLLWSLHAWILELRLATAVAGDPEPSFLRDLDARIERLVRPGDVWLEIESFAATRQLCVACAPPEAVPVNTLAWPNLLGARLAMRDAAPHPARGLSFGVGGDTDVAWLRLGNRFAEIPASVSPAIMKAATRAATLVSSPTPQGRGYR